MSVRKSGGTAAPPITVTQSSTRRASTILGFHSNIHALTETHLLSGRGQHLGVGCGGVVFAHVLVRLRLRPLLPLRCSLLCGHAYVDKRVSVFMCERAHNCHAQNGPELTACKHRTEHAHTRAKSHAHTEYRTYRSLLLVLRELDDLEAVLPLVQGVAEVSERVGFVSVLEPLLPLLLLFLLPLCLRSAPLPLVLFRLRPRRRLLCLYGREWVCGCVSVCLSVCVCTRACVTQCECARASV